MRRDRSGPRRALALLAGLGVLLAAAGPDAAAADEVVVYSSVDEENAKKLLDAFTKATGVQVRFTFLSSGPAVARLEAERANPRADVWFGAPSENHVAAREKGLTQPYLSPGARDLADKFKDRQGYWTSFYMNPLGFGVNCAELLENTNRELGKAIDESKQEHYVYILNHLTNAWKFAMNVMGANLNKEGVEDEDNLTVPTEYSLDQNNPNPFNPSTTLNYQLPENNHVSLKVYDILGNLVSTLVDEEMEAGYYSVNWNASQLASGIYIYRIISGSYVSTKKMILMK